MFGVLQFFIQFVMGLCEVAWLAFMTACTVIVITMRIHGDIRINIVRDKTEKEDKEK